MSDARLLERQDRLVEAVELFHELSLPAEHFQLQIGVLELQQHLATGDESAFFHQHFGDLPAFDGIEVGRASRCHERVGRHVFREHGLAYG